MRLRRSSSLNWFSRLPCNAMSPRSGSQKRIMRYAIVVLPAPERPTMATVLPDPMPKETLARAWGSPCE